ncbi:hypothetical protein IAD21_05062 [Abditibacteriota bacterium]|nr:hypothetical protein IAD21_05062 [Abditibacteriota bacterium]
MKGKFNPGQIVGSTSLILPFVAWRVTQLWLDSLFIFSGNDMGYRDVPAWVERLGLNPLTVGFVPSLLCGLWGICSAVWGVWTRQGYAVGGGYGLVYQPLSSSFPTG